MDKLYPIGEVARRTGLSVSAIRYYAEAGIITPTGHTATGYRLYDVRAIAGLELVRTLRELGASLDEIRRVLTDEITLQELATAHLAVLERQSARLRARQAVLRAVVGQRVAADQVGLMHQVVSMSDDDRAQLVEDFWTEVTDGLDVQDVVGHLRPRRPALPPEPTSEQLEAWIELADMVRDAGFRRALRRYLRETFAGAAAHDPANELTDEEAGNLVTILTQARAAAEAGLPVGSPEARQLAGRWVEWMAARTGDRDIADVQRQIAAADPGPQVDRHVRLLGRYSSLTATINGTPQPGTAGAPGSTWLHAAVAALP